MEHATSQVPPPLEKLFCCSTIATSKKNNIPPFHPLHQLLAHLNNVHNQNNDDQPAVTAENTHTPAETPTSEESIPGPGECVIIILSDPCSTASADSSTAAQATTFDPSKVVSRMFCGRIASTESDTISETVSSSPTQSQAPPSTNSAWQWRENISARDNVQGVLAQVSGVDQSVLRKEMTGCECSEHGWKFTFVVLIGVDQQAEANEMEVRRQREKEMLLEMAAAAGSRAGARDGAPEVPAGCNPQ